MLDADVVAATRANPARSNLVSRLAEQLAGAIRDEYGPDAALPGRLRDAVNTFRYVDPKTLPDDAPARALSAEPHSFCRIMTGAAWDVLVALFRAAPGADPAAALASAADRTASICVAAADTAPSGADFFGRVARRLVRETAAREGTALARTVGELLVKRRLLDSPDVPAELSPDEDPGLSVLPDDATGNVVLARAVVSRLPDREGAVLVRGTRGAAPEAAAGLRVLRGRRRRDLLLRGREFGPANGACVEIADGFALGFDGGGFLRASRVHAAGDHDEEDARAFVRFLVRRRRIAEVGGFAPDSVALARERKTHAVVRDPDGVRRLKRIWIARETP